MSHGRLSDRRDDYCLAAALTDTGSDVAESSGECNIGVF